MLIKKIEISNFGKIRNKALNINPEIQVIYGPNEYGKSTMMEFIRLIFYSYKEGDRASAKDKSVREKYAPWSGLPMGGALEISNGENVYKIQKQISSVSPLKDVTLFYNVSTGETIHLGKKEEVGMRFFSIDSKSFERSSYVGSIGKSDFDVAKNSQDTLADKILSNLSDTGEADISKSLVAARLKDAIKDLESVRGNGGRIFKIKSAINLLNEKIKNFYEQKEEYDKFRERIKEISELREEQKNLENKLFCAKKHRKIVGLKKILELKAEKERLLKDLLRDKVSFDEFLEECKFLEQIKNNVKKLTDKAEEINNLIKSVGEDSSLISQKDVDVLNSRVQEKEKIENSLIKIKCLKSLSVKSVVQNAELLAGLDKSFCEKISQISNHYFQAEKELKAFEEKQKNLEEELKALGNKEKNEESFNQNVKLSLKKEKNLFIFMLCLWFFVFATGAFYGLRFASFLSLLCAACFSVIGAGYSLLRYRKRLKKLMDISNEESKKESFYHSKASVYRQLSQNINQARLNVSSAENEFNDFINEYMTDLKLKTASLVDNINKILKEKNCSCINDCYEVYARTKNNEHLSASCKNILNESESLKKEFVNKICTYKDVMDYSDALAILDNFMINVQKIREIDAKIKVRAETAQVSNTESEYIKDIVLKLGLDVQSGFEYNEEDINSTGLRFEALKNMNLDEEYFKLVNECKKPHGDIWTMKQNLIAESQKLVDAQKYLSSLKLAFNIFEESSDYMRKNFNPKLDFRASEIFESLTGGKYKKLHINNDYNILINDNMVERVHTSLSSGTVDQAYLALRIAVSELIADTGTVPLILDDIFMQYDKDRLNHALNFLKNYSKSCQIIIFTCHEHIAKSAQELGISIIG